MLAQTSTTALGSGAWIAIAVAVVIVVLLAALAVRRQRSAGLRKRFGPEYDRTLAATGSRNRAEAELERREKRVRALDIRPITPGARARYTESWRAIQSRFVDDPRGAVADADALLTDAMRDRGYPVDTDPDRRMADLSVEHAAVIDNYRTATAIARRSEAGSASTEDLRQAMVSYRSLFADLVGADPARLPDDEGRIVEPKRRDTARGVRA